MHAPRLVLEFEGLPAEGGDIRLFYFVKILEYIYVATKRFDKAMSDTGNQTFYYRIVDLRYSSPAMVAVEPCQINPKQSMNIDAINKPLQLWRNIEQGKVEQVALPYLEDAQHMAEYIQKGMKSINISYNGEEYKITQNLKTKIDLALIPQEHYLSSVRGILEYFNIHGNIKIFRIYSEIEPKMLKCSFPNELMDKAISAIGRHIEVRGTLSYRAAAKFPDEIEVKEIDIFPPDEELPNIDDLKGIYPNLTNGIPSEDFVKELRNARKG